MSETLSGKLKYSKGVSEFMYVGVRFMDIVVHFHTSANSLGEILYVAAKYPYNAHRVQAFFFPFSLYTRIKSVALKITQPL